MTLGITNDYTAISKEFLVIIWDYIEISRDYIIIEASENL